MAYAQLQKEVEESKLEIQRLRQRMSLGAPTIHKELSLIALIPKRPGSETTNHLEFILTLEASARIGRREPKNTVEIIALKLVASIDADPASSRFNLWPKFQMESVAGQNFEPTLTDRSKAVLRCYRCQGIGHFAKECPARRRRRGRTRNSPGKGNPSERARSHEAKSNPRY